MQFLLYGANGYTGRIITGLAATYGLKPILAGRNESAVRFMAEQYLLSYRIIDLDDNAGLITALKDISVLLNAAGPFRHTAKKMIEACLHTRTHYLDITGEIEVFEMAKKYDVTAKAAGIMIMPGTGFDVVPTDCLALFLKNKLPDANQLRLAFASLGGGLSHGTATTMTESLSEGGAVRKNGVIVKTPLGHKKMRVDFGLKKLFVMTIPWGDISTAYHTTNIPDIETYTAISPGIYKLLKIQPLFNWLLRTSVVRNFIRKKINKRPGGPDDASRSKGRSLVWGEVENAGGYKVSALQTGPDGYTLTAHSSLIICAKVLGGNYKPGYQTPAGAFGDDVILEVPGVERWEV